ncbi:shikimate dehydrogenase [Clostridium moniliforme]|uniref:Shikimate dehydrogenase (NADP(+)) n=1 Tax=Clostridium moniliforme TaxID=39489 RepID=A0ABS4EZ17_9CLOT|nr:shikimate dehydrogenase [Clostridium moniliforme]MBP1889245.1 shikimate dehydrogenase [Clostridium moniliforme]
MKSLESYRKEIDKIDNEITKLFEKRMNVVLKVAEYKKENNLPIFNEEREEKVIKKNVDRLENKDYTKEIEEFFINLMKVSKDLQKRKLGRVEEKSDNQVNFYGLIGEKLSHSISPKIHNMIFETLNVNDSYRLFEIPKENIGNLREALKTLTIRGVNVTIPYKEKVIEYLDEISKEAKNIGAVNTIFNKSGKLIGYNTDYYGFKYMLEDKNINVTGKKVTVLGTGGASKAVITYLLDSHVSEILLVSRKKKDVYKNEEKIKVIEYKDLKGVLGDIIINTTPVGMYPKMKDSPVTLEIIKNYDVLVDLIYNPLETEFIKLGKENNKITCSGLMMLVGQAVKAEEIWQDKTIDKKVIIDIYNKLIKEFKSRRSYEKER